MRVRVGVPGGSTRILLAALVAALIVLPAPVAGQSNPAAERVATLRTVLDTLNGTGHAHASGTAAHSHGVGALSPEELAVLGLRPGSGPCLGMLEANGPVGEHRCSHGPDSVPGAAQRAESLAAGGSVANLTVPSPPPNWTIPTKVPCYSTGPFIQAIWVYPQGASSRLTTFRDHVRRHMAAMDLMFNVSAKAVTGTNGLPSIRHIRWAHDASCVPTVTELSVPASAFGDIYATYDYLASTGKITASKKYIAFLDMDGCGGGVAFLDQNESTSSSNPNNQGGSYGQMFGCLGLFHPYWDGGLIAAHELMHTLGGVQNGAPHSTSGHCWDDDPNAGEGNDIMCYDDGYPGAFSRPSACPVTAPETFDCRKDDYFNPNPPTGNYLKTHWNTASNQFLASVEPPSYWTIPLPSATISAGTGYIGGDAASITATTTVPSGAKPVARVAFLVNGTEMGSDSSAPYSIELDTFGYANLTKLKVTAQPYDTLGYPGNASTATLTVANPQVHLDAPTEFSYNSPMLTWAARAAGFGNRTVSSVQLYVNGVAEGPADTAAPYGGTANLSDLVFFPGGADYASVQLRVTDSAGVQRFTQERTVYLATASAFGSISGFEGFPTRLGPGSQALSASVAPPPAPAVSKVEFLINGVEVGEDTTVPYSVPWTATAGASGTLVLRVIDAKGYSVETDPAWFEVATTAVTATVTTPASGATITGSSVPVTVTPSVPEGWTVSAVYLESVGSSIFPSLSPDGDANGPWSGELDSRDLSNGWQILIPFVSAYDESFNSVDVYGRPIVVRVANSGPTASVTAPADGSKVRQTVNLTASVSGATPSYVEFYVGEEWIGGDDTAPFSVPWDTTQGSDGVVRVKAIAYLNDAPWEVTSATRFYVVSNLYAFQTDPDPGQVISGTFLLKAGARCDRDCTIEKATFYIDGQVVNYDRAAPFQYALDTTNYADGTHTFGVTFTTSDYRAISSATRTMTIDN